eukprot:gb/GFBE01026606.1/.p1 GENE.gb/GFBE01026606.1/~~gb/GFBE01026606.1/.p1  ORF type:complete len:262 (+),score=59.13 gb/GFBE01026606.1/:1-786(+)
MADDEGNAVAGLALGAARERSANLFSDPKMKELQNYTRSHQHEARLRESAELEERVRAAQGMGPVPVPADMSDDSLRREGCSAVNTLLMRVASEKATLPITGSDKTLPAGFGGGDEKAKEEPMMPKAANAVRMNQFETRLRWRKEMDHSLRRLMQDMELARDDRLKEYSHQARCGHLDKIFDWYQTHGKKEARKEQIAPPYVRYTLDGPVMPGSMRVSRKEKEKAANVKKDPNGMGHSSSSPALMAAGSLGLDSTPKHSVG